MLRKVLFFVLVLLLSTQGTTADKPAETPARLYFPQVTSNRSRDWCRPGDPWEPIVPTITHLTAYRVAGQVDARCGLLLLTVYAGDRPGGEVLGEETVGPGGKFNVRFRRLIREGETITLYTICRRQGCLRQVVQVRTLPPIPPLCDFERWQGAVALERPLRHGDRIVEGRTCDYCSGDANFLEALIPGEEILGYVYSFDDEGRFRMEVYPPLEAGKEVLFYGECGWYFPTGGRFKVWGKWSLPLVRVNAR